MSMSTITFTWEPPDAPERLGASIDAVADSLYARFIPLEAAGETMRLDIRQHFETETDPEGNKWKGLSWKYISGTFPKNSEGRPLNPRQQFGTTLKDTGELMRRASASEAIVVTNDTVFYRTQSLPQYGLAHESGVPGRTTSAFGTGTYENPLPKRSFLGMSAQSEAAVYGYFADWFDGSIALYPTSTGRIGRRHAKHIVGPTGMHIFVPNG